MAVNSRRELFKYAAGLAVTGALEPLAISLAGVSAAIGATSGPYRALIFINFSGGNDSHNTVLATDPTSWGSYLKYRDTSSVTGSDSIALPLDALLTINPANAANLNSGRSFALNPKLINLQRLFSAGQAAIVSNVGPMIAPITAAQFAAKTVPVPLNLFSHNSQTATWQAFAGEGTRYGWGGKLADTLTAGNPYSQFTTISTSGNSVFLAGQSTTALQVGPGGLNPINSLVQTGKLAASIYGDGSADASSQALATLLANGNSNDLFAGDVRDVVQNSIKAQSQLAQNLTPTAGVPAPPGANGVAKNLQTVLRLMSSASRLGVNRQVFYLSFGGFDHHDGEVVGHALLMSMFDEAVGYFHDAAASMGLGQAYVMCTGSEFGRTFTSNGDGCDHGWGAHHFVIGNAVKGGDIYGRFPTLGVNNPDNVGSALLPAISVDQYGATMAKWLGVADSAMNDIFPNLKNFSQRDLGFLKN